MSLNFLKDRRKKYEEKEYPAEMTSFNLPSNLPGGPVCPENFSRKKTTVFLSFAFIGVSAIAGYLWYQLSVVNDGAFSDNTSKTSVVSSQNEIEELVEKVGKLMVLPSDETPTVATVSDPEKLNNQPFFTGAKAGDKVLIYSKSQKAILYDSVANKIINVAPINIDNK